MYRLIVPLHVYGCAIYICQYYDDD